MKKEKHQKQVIIIRILTKSKCKENIQNQKIFWLEDQGKQKSTKNCDKQKEIRGKVISNKLIKQNHQSAINKTTKKGLKFTLKYL